MCPPEYNQALRAATSASRVPHALRLLRAPAPRDTSGDSPWHRDSSITPKPRLYFLCATEHGPRSLKTAEPKGYPRPVNSRVLPPVATSALIALALSFFYLPHLLGEAVFPWDFRGGYHAQAFAWYADGSFFAPPEWFPYGDFGFPAALALQSCGWVLPLSMLSTLDIPFTFTNLARLQIVLVWFAGLGISALARVERMSWTAAAVVGVGYTLSSAFYANQQHVDVIRGYVLLPWVLLALHRRTARHRFAIALLAIAVFQYLVAAYPGQILAGALLFTLYLSVQVRATTSLERRRYLIATAAGGISGLLMSMVKWYPVVENWTLLEPNAATRPALVHGAHLWTLLFSVSPHFVPNEITLRSLFIPASIVAAVATIDYAQYICTCLRRREYKARVVPSRSSH